MPDNPTNPNPQDDVDGGAPDRTPPAPEPSIFNDLAAKKGFKSHEDLAKSYVDLETDRSKRLNAFDTAKKQVEQQSNGNLTLDDNGNVVSISGQPTQPAYQPPTAQPPAETIYDPYTGSPITDPIALQLSKLPLGHREAAVFGFLAEQRDKQQTQGYQNDVEVLSKPEAKGFEEDVRKAMMQLPLAQRANKQEWENALLRVKGARYDKDKQIWAQQGAETFIEKENLQSVDGTPGAVGGLKLTSEQESTYDWYRKNQPGMFKDKAHFARMLSPAGGR